MQKDTWPLLIEGNNGCGTAILKSATLNGACSHLWPHMRVIKDLAWCYPRADTDTESAAELESVMPCYAHLTLFQRGIAMEGCRVNQPVGAMAFVIHTGTRMRAAAWQLAGPGRFHWLHKVGSLALSPQPYRPSLVAPNLITAQPTCVCICHAALLQTPTSILTPDNAARPTKLD